MYIPISEDIKKFYVNIQGTNYPVNRMLLNTQEVTGVEVYGDYYSQYFTIESLEDNNVVMLTKGTSTSVPDVTFYYSTDGTTWTSTNDTTSWNLDKNDKIMLKATTNRLHSGSDQKWGGWSITGTKTHNAYGNIMSLLYGDDFEDKTLVYSYSFAYLFVGNSYLINTKNLKLPNNATTYCYSHMFDSCTALATSPTLPATTMQTGCYIDMFWNCFSLTTAPELPATTLAASCYTEMFRECRALVNAPVLPSTTLSYRCYYNMFSGCTSLVNAPVLPATTLASYCYYYMFQGCTSIVESPELPAPTLVEGCYSNMFSGCTSLNKVTCLATDIGGNTAGWLYNVASTGTFYKDSTMTNWPSGDSGIPTGWTIQNYN